MLSVGAEKNRKSSRAKFGRSAQKKKKKKEKLEEKKKRVGRGKHCCPEVHCPLHKLTRSLFQDLH